MLPHDHSNGGAGSGSSNIIRSLRSRDNPRRGTMAVVAVGTTRKRRRLLLVYAVSFFGAAVVVFAAGGYRKHSMGAPMDPPAALLSSTPAPGFQSSPPSESDKNQEEPATGPRTASSGPLPAEIHVGETEVGSTGEEGAGTASGLAVASGAASSDRVAVYVYDGIPELDHSDLVKCYREKNGGVAPWQDEQADMAQDMGEIWLHRAVLAHPWRVFDPEEADVFFVPIYPILSIKLALAGQRPWAPVDMDEHRCRGLTHYGRMTIAVDYLVRSSLYFNRFGGADHVVICAWWDCQMALNPTHRMLLRRTVVGINERNYAWTRWGCGNGRALTVPYTASSVLTTSDMIGGLPASDRGIPFFFVGTARDRPERENLDVVMNISSDSIILLGGDGLNWGMNSTEYAAHMSRSRFCFCPRGDTPSSRRIFDAVAAGCIPIVTETGVAVLPFVEVGLNYSEFAVVVDASAFSTREGVENVTREALARSDEERDALLRSVRKGASSIVYGTTRGPDLEDMHPYLDTATEFLKAASVLTGADDEGKGEEGDEGSMWSCPETNLREKFLALRTSSSFPPPQDLSRQWLAATETIVNKERSLLFCAPPNTGSLQFRMLAKRMQGVSHWSVHDDRSLLFDREASELELLDITDRDLLTAIYQANGSGWIKIGVVRDPVTRLLSAYLSLVKTWRAGLQLQPHLPLSGEAENGADAPHENIQHNRQLRQRRHEELDVERRRLEQVRGKGLPSIAGTKIEWDLFDAVVGKRQQRRSRRRRLQQWQEGGDREGNAAEDEGFHQSEGGGGGGRAAEQGDGEVTGQATEAHRRSVFRPDYQPQPRRQYQRRKQRRRATVLEDQAKNDGEPGDGGDNREAFFWEGPGGWNGPVGAAKAVEGIAGGEESGDGVGDGAGDSGAEIGIPTFLEVLDTLKDGIWNAPPAFRPAISMCGQKNSPFDSIIPFERLQKTSTEVLKSLPGDVWEEFGASGWGPDDKNAFMEFDYGEAASAWRTSISGSTGSSSGGGGNSAEVGGEGDSGRSLVGEPGPEPEPEREAVAAVDRGVDETNVGANQAQRRRGMDEQRGLGADDEGATPLPLRARDLFDGEDPCAWVEYYDSLDTLEEVGRLYEMDYNYYRWYRLGPWREKLQACLQHRR